MDYTLLVSNIPNPVYPIKYLKRNQVPEEILTEYVSIEIFQNEKYFK
jgi:hypothetical protein